MPPAPSDENQLSMTSFLIGAVVVVGLFVAIQIGRTVLAPEEQAPPPPTTETDPPPVDEDELEEPETPNAELKQPHLYDPPVTGKVEWDPDRRRIEVTNAFDERTTFPVDAIIGLEEQNGELNLRMSDGKRVTVEQEFVDSLPTRVRYQFDYESSGNVATDGNGTPLDSDPEGRPITSGN